MLFHSRPVYLGIAVDVGPHMISGEGLETPLITSLIPNDPKLESDMVSHIVKKLHECAKPVIIVDGCKLLQR